MFSFIKNFWSKPIQPKSCPSEILEPMSRWLHTCNLSSEAISHVLVRISTEESKILQQTLTVWNRYCQFMQCTPGPNLPIWNPEQERYNSNLLLLWSITQWLQTISINVSNNIANEIEIHDMLSYLERVAKVLHYSDLNLIEMLTSDQETNIRNLCKIGAWGAHIIFETTPTVQDVRHPALWVLDDECYSCTESALHW